MAMALHKGEARIENSQMIEAHLQIIQSVIQRMAGNSAACKTWSVTLVSAIMVLVADSGVARYSVIAAIPIAAFLLLDAYYLALERTFRGSYNEFVKKVGAGAVYIDDLLLEPRTRKLFWETIMSVGSFSVWPFYVTLLTVTLAVGWMLKG